MQTYTHRPLSPGRVIRILLLQPHHNPSEPIRIKLQEISLPSDKKERGAHEALSYVWGAPIGDQPIECDGNQLLITKNCLAALQRLRLKSEVRKLWIDAVCIDQEAAQEKNHQFKLMGEVYFYAQQVLIWLGQGDDRIVALMDQISRTELPDSRAAIAAIISNEWFYRAWTAQELCYAQDPVMIYGQIQVPWATFVTCLDPNQPGIEIPMHLYRPYNDTISFRKSFHLLTDSLKLNDKPWGPGWSGPVQPILFGLLRSRSSSRPEDKIYAFYQVLTDLGFILPDPNVSRSVAELYEETTYLLIEQAHSLKMLEYLPTKSRMDNLPSWVPDYSQKIWSPSHQVVEAVRSLPQGQTIEHIIGQLKLRAIYFDVIVALSDRMPDIDQVNLPIHSQAQHDIALRCYETMHSWMKFVVGVDAPMAYDQYAEVDTFLEQDPIDILGETHAVTDMKLVDIARLTALAKLVVQVKKPTDYESPSEYVKALSTLSANLRLWFQLQFVYDTKARNMIADTHPDKSVVERLRKSYPPLILSLIHDRDQEKNPRQNDMIKELEMCFVYKNPEQILYATERGLLGMTLGQVKKDDVVALLPGSAVPLLLRAVDRSKRMFQVVGLSFLPDCHVDWNDPKIADEDLDDVILV